MKKITTVACAMAVIGAFSVGTTAASANTVTVPNLAGYCAKLTNAKAKSKCESAAARVQAAVNAAIAKRKTVATPTNLAGLKAQFDALIAKYGSQLSNLNSLNLGGLTLGGLNLGNLSGVNLSNINLSSLSSALGGLNLSGLNLSNLNLSNIGSLLGGLIKR